MKLKYLNKVLGWMWIATFTVGCNDWTEIESISNIDLNAPTKTEQDYADLRAWKATPGLPQVFVWFDNWSGEFPTGESSLRGLPDSVTIASNWGGHPKFNLSAERRADMEYVQKVKGTKVVVTLFSAKIGEDVPPQDIFATAGNSTDPEVVRPAIKAYAEAIYDEVIANGYDGYDWDYEPNGGGGSGNYLWKNKVQRTIFVEELSYWFGKGATDPNRDRGDRKPAKPGLLFLIDGEIGIGGRMDKDWLSYYVDYFVLQAYGSSNPTSRVTGVLTDMDKWIQAGTITPEEVIKRTIVTENFESYATTGGQFLKQSSFIYKGTYKVGEETVSLDRQIGGCGIYRVGFDYNQGKGDYDGSPEYYYLRQGITNIYRIYRERQQVAQDEKKEEETK